MLTNFFVAVQSLHELLGILDGKIKQTSILEYYELLVLWIDMIFLFC